MKTVLAIDLGSASLRAYLGYAAADGVRVSEIYRCPNAVHQDEDGSLVWDYQSLTSHVIEAAKAATAELGGAPDSFAIDGWGVDTVCLDANGNPVCPVFAYRDSRGARGRALLASRISEQQTYQLTGVAPQDINTVYRLAYAQEKGLLPPGAKLMFLQDGLARALAEAELPGWDAPVRCEPWAGIGVASTSGMLLADKSAWATEVCQAARIPAQLLPPLKNEPAVVARRGKTAVVACGSHDTGCAVYGMGLAKGDVFVSLGSWAVVGALSEPVTQGQLTNEAAVGGGNRAQLNRVGMWLAQECRRYWQEQGEDVAFARLDALAAEEPSPGVLIDPDDPRFGAPGDMPARITQAVLESTGKKVSGIAPLLRLITESVAVSIAKAIRDIRAQTGASGTVHIGGGGTKDALLLRLLATELGEPLEIHIGEMSVRGNILAQLHALGESFTSADFLSDKGQYRVAPAK